MRVKSNVYGVRKGFIAMILNQFECRIKVVRNDNGSKFFNSVCDELFSMHCIIQQSSCPYTTRQNRLVEKR